MADKRKRDDEQQQAAAGEGATNTPEVAPAATPAAKAYRVQSNALGRWRQGDTLTADDVGGEERVQVLLARGALAEAE